MSVPVPPPPPSGPPPPPGGRPGSRIEREIERQSWISVVLGAVAIALLVAIVTVPSDAVDGALLIALACVAIAVPTVVIVNATASGHLGGSQSARHVHALWALIIVAGVADYAAVAAVLAHFRWILAVTLFAATAVVLGILYFVLPD